MSFMLFISIAKAQFPAPYCAEAYGSGVEPITSVILNTLTNTSPDATGGTAHEDYTSSSTSLVVGGTYSITVQGNTDGSFKDYIRVFFDWNQDGDFDDAGESFDVGTITNSTGLDTIKAVSNITVPLGATLGATRMRVSKKWNAYQLPCNTGGYGESEDYTINVLAASGCTGKPTAGTATGATQACTGNTFTLTLTGSTVASAIHYQWQTTTIGGSSWANILNDTTPTINVVQGAVGADYRCIVTCTNGSLDDTSTKASVAIQTTGCPPINDACTTATNLTLGSPMSGTTVDATQTMAATICSSFTGTADDDVWYTFTAPASGNVTISSTPTGTLDGVIVAYSGTCGSFTELDCSDKTFGGGTEVVSLTALTAGTVYYFRIYSYGSGATSMGAFTALVIETPTPPTTCATNTLPANAATNVTNTPAVVLRWSVVAGATSYDVYHGTVNPPTTLVGTSTTDSALITGTAYTTTYYWYVVPKNAGGSATGCDANVTSYTTSGVPASAANDDPCDAITLVLDGASDCKNSAFATSVGDPTSFACSSPNNTLWYKYTPAASGNVQFTFTPPASGDTLNGWLGVYTASGSCPGTLTFTDMTSAALGTCKSFGAFGSASTVFFANLTGGTDYYFMIDGVSGDVGQYCVSIQTPPPAPATCATNSLPANNAIDVSAPSTTLKWVAVSGATSYDVYFGTANPPTTVFATVTADSAQIGGLAYSTVYNWYVVPKNGGGAATGCDANLTSFTTKAPPPPPSNDECDSAFAIIANTPTNGTNTSATQSQVADLCAGSTSTSAADVWYSFTTNQSGNATISVAPVIGSGLDLVVVVYSGTCGSFTSIGCSDNFAGGATEIVNLTGLTASTQYYFRVYGYGSLTSNQGNYVITATGTALPVSITKFTGEKRGSTNLLSWTTSTEVNNKGFELQRSATGDRYLPLSFVETKAINGNSSAVLSYQATDTKPYSGNTYYRLKQVDKNGKISYSNIVSIKGDKVNNLVISDVYPNPASNILNMVVASPNDEMVSVVVTDITGKILQKQATQINSGNNSLKLNVSHLASGSYLLKLVCSNGCNSATIKFVKQ